MKHPPLLGALILFSLVVPVAKAGTDLMIYPTRVVFDQNQRSAKIDLTNTSSEMVTYRISVENKRMTPTGEFVSIKEEGPGEKFASKIIEFSPRQVELAPGAGQTIRVLVRKPSDLLPGEYRSHLVFSRLPDAKTNSIEGGPQTGASEIGIRLTALIGISIPVIVTQGATDVALKITNLRLRNEVKSEPSVLEMNLERTGNRSAYGNLSVHYLSASGGDDEVAEAKGLAVYAPNPLRTVKLTVRPKEGAPLSKGKLFVTFRESRE